MSLKPIYWIMVGILLLTACGTAAPPTVQQQAGNQIANQAVASTSTPLPAASPTVDRELIAEIDSIRQKCADTQAGQVCFGQKPLKAEVQPNRLLFRFWDTGDMTNLADLHRLKVGTTGTKEGLALLLIQTEHPGQAFTAIAFGDVEMINEVPYGVQEFGGMQSMRLVTGPNEKGSTPANGLIVQAPEDGKLHTLVVNGVELLFGSTALLTSSGKSLTVHTLAGRVEAFTPEQTIDIQQGTSAEILLEPLVQPEGAELLQPLTQPEGAELLQPLVRLLPKEPDPYGEDLLDQVRKIIKRRIAEREKQKNWKGGWWKETFGQESTSGDCSEEMEIGGDGGSGGGGGDPVEPYSREIPICRGNNGNTILIWDSGTSYERIGPNTYTNFSVAEYDLYNTGDFAIDSNAHILRVISPTRIAFTNTSTSGKGCTSTRVTYLDFVRDDPNVRCGRIIDLFPEPQDVNPEPTEIIPTPVPLEDQPLEGNYTVQIGTPVEGCDEQAAKFMPDFQTAAVRFSPEKNLILEGPSIRYEMNASDQSIEYFSDRTGDETDKYGVFTLEQPLADSFQIMMSLMAIPDQGLLGDWLVTNADRSQMCEGSILLSAVETGEEQ